MSIKKLKDLKGAKGVKKIKKIFVVHGRKEKVRESIARFITQLGYEPVILHEQPNRGRTIIEKFERYSKVAFAVVLLTPDDKGCLATENVDTCKDKCTFRARQNVILELGFFLGSLGRDKVCTLYCENVEIPSDYQGVAFVPLDQKGAWKFELAKEMKAAKLDIDLNKIVQ